jgi:hypothetical protein
MKTMLLDYVALAALLLSITALFYLFVYIHDLPHSEAKKRNHPQAEAIHYACWLSLFTLHAIWPLVYMWAVSSKPIFHVKLDGGVEGENDAKEVARLSGMVKKLEARLEKVETKVAVKSEVVSV